MVFTIYLFLNYIPYLFNFMKNNKLSYKAFELLNPFRVSFCVCMCGWVWVFSFFNLHLKDFCFITFLILFFSNLLTLINVIKQEKISTYLFIYLFIKLDIKKYLKKTFFFFLRRRKRENLKKYFKK